MADKRKGPLEGPIKRILESQDRMEANVAKLTAAASEMKLDIVAIKAWGNDRMIVPHTFLARLFWRLGL